MREILLLGNPNVGKSTLFNSLTKSSVHTGNFHGVTTDSFSNKINYNSEDVLITDLPGIYSLSGFSNEEKVTRDKILNSKASVVVIADIFCLRRCMYLCAQLDEMGKGYILVINTKGKKNIDVNIELLQSRLKHKVYLINAKKEKFDKKYIENNEKNSLPNYIEKYVENMPRKASDKAKNILALNGVDNDVYNENEKYIESIYEELVTIRYEKIDEILNGCYEKSLSSGDSKLDKFLLNPILMPILFFSVFIFNVYLMFFIIGPLVGEWISIILNKFMFEPILNFVAIKFDSVWLVEFLEQAVFGSVGTIINFIPQVFMLFAFLTILEESGIITRLSYVLDDVLHKVGLNGKSVYTLLLGFGCNTMSSMASTNLNEKNMRAKCLIISPYISCMARLPLYILLASCFFGKFAFLVISGLYLLGLVVAIIMSKILDKTILPSKSGDVFLEFPNLVLPNIKTIFLNAGKNILEFIYRIFTVVLAVGVVVYLLTHLGINFRYTPNITESILYFISSKLSFVLAPIGLDNAGVLTCLVVGVFAKELIVSTMSIVNQAGPVGLGESIINSSSIIHFTPAGAVSMLVFSLLYSSCASNYAIMRKTKGVVLLTIVSQLAVAYVVSFVVYQTIERGILYALTVGLVIAMIVFAIIFFLFKILKNNKCDNCIGCRR